MLKLVNDWRHELTRQALLLACQDPELRAEAWLALRDFESKNDDAGPPVREARPGDVNQPRRA